MSVYDLYQSYLNQTKASPVMASPVVDPSYLLYLQQQQQGGGGDGPYQEPQLNQQHAGIYSIKDVFEKFQNIPTPLNIARMGIQGIANLISNIQNPNVTAFGQPTEAYQTQLEKMAQKKLDFQQFTGGGGNNGGHPGGAAAAAAAAAQAADDTAAGAGGY